MRRNRCNVLFLVLLVPAGASQLAAQMLTAAISGTVMDGQEGALQSARVCARNTATNVSQWAVTDDLGLYRIPALPPGEYEIQASSRGYETVSRRGITLTVSSQPVVDFKLPLGAVKEVIVVDGQMSQVETHGSAIASLVSSDQAHDLPLNGRNYGQLLALAPGVQMVPQTPPGGGGSQTFYGSGTNYSTSGSRPEGQAILLDGTDIQGFWNHGAGSVVTGNSLGIESIAEFRFFTNTYDAQFGGTGAAVNIVSKSGTNAWNGSLYEYLRNSSFDARNFFDGATLPGFRRNQFGGSVGGPMRKDRLFVFVNDEALLSSQGFTGNQYVPDDAARLGLLPCNTLTPQPAGCGRSTPRVAVPISASVQPILTKIDLQPNGPELPVLSGPYAGYDSGFALYRSVANQEVNENYLLARLDYDMPSHDALLVRYLSDKAYQSIPYPVSSLPDWPEIDHSANQYLTAEEKHILRSGVSLFRASLVRTHENAATRTAYSGADPLNFFPGSGRQDGQITVGGGGTPIGAAGTVPFSLVQNKFTGAGDVFLSKGAHDWKAGLSLERVQTNMAAPFSVGGTFMFGGLQQFYAAQPLIFLGMAAPSPDFTTSRYFREIDLFPYVQDSWKVTSRITLNFGARYEFISNPVAVSVPLEAILNPATSTGFTQVNHVFARNPNCRNLDPRAGLAWDPFGDHKMAVRAGFAIYHEPLAPRTYASAFYLAPPSGSTMLFGGNLFPNPYTSGVALPYTAFAGVDYQTSRAPYVMQFNLFVERELGHAITGGLAYVGSAGVHLFSQRDQNPPILNPDGTFGSTRTNPNFGSLNETAATSHSTYHALQVSLNRQLSRRLEGQLAFTWSKCIDNGSATSGLEQGAFEVEDPYNQRLDRAVCGFNASEAFRANYLYRFPASRYRLLTGWQLAGLFTASSGLPFSILDGKGLDQANLGGIEGDRPSYNPNPAAGCRPSQVIGKADQYYNPQCYVLQPFGTLGNVPRNGLAGPGLASLDVSVMRNSRLGERVTAQFRVELFNALNHTNLGQPNPNIFANGPGQAAIYNPAAGQITSTSSSSRQVQLVLKILF